MAVAQLLAAEFALSPEPSRAEEDVPALLRGIAGQLETRTGRLRELDTEIARAEEAYV